MCQPLGWHYFVKMTGYLPFTLELHVALTNVDLNA